MKTKAYRKKFLQFWTQNSYILVLLLTLLGYALTVTGNGNTFRWSHIAAILGSQNTCIVGTIALGMALVILTGQIDLSVGSALVLCSGVTILVFNLTDSVVLMLLAALLSGLLCGALNGCLVVYGRIPPFVATLGTMLIFRSLTLTVVRDIDPEIAGSASSQFAMLAENSKYDLVRMRFGVGKLSVCGFELPYITIVFLLMAVIFAVMMQKTAYGKSIYAVGSNEKSALLAGIRVSRVKLSVYMLTGLMVGVASVLQACKIGNVTPSSSGQSYEMYAISAVVLGGISMAGGKGKLQGVIFGTLSYTTINFIIVSVSELSVDIQGTFHGLVLILVILVQSLLPAIRTRFRHKGT